MSKTIRNTPKTSKHEQLRRLNGMRGFRPLNHRAAEQMRERAFAALYGKQVSA